MAYCRFSSDDFRCDVYVYEDVTGGWTTHVAGNRRAESYTPMPNDIDFAQMEEWEKANLVPIKLPHAGETFNDATPGECADRLESLRALGYQVPQRAIDLLREEQKGMGHEGQG